MKCPKCGYPVLPKFTKCPHCGESLIKEDNNTNLPDANDFSIVKGRAIWNVQKGEIAHLIKETELINTDGLKGVIVQEGCSAIVFYEWNHHFHYASWHLLFSNKRANPCYKTCRAKRA